MIIPIRCFTCGKVIGDKWDDYMSYQKQGYRSGDAMDLLGLHRMCCRRMFLSHSEQTHILLLFNPADRYTDTEKLASTAEDAEAANV
mmetsp:Transcript_27678/g.38503  ORF Transcript_27678/g.38503 Transcript_27678/m.38503 type:complete len:87 (-) Transcript_27678:5-265(-)